MDEKIVLEETGFVPVQLGEAVVTIDLFQTHNRLVELRDEYADKPASAFNDAVAGYVAELGLPRPSHRTAIAFMSAIFRRVEGLEKKDESPVSTSPTSS